MSVSVLYMSMSLDGYIAGPNDEPDNPGGDGFMRLHDWYGFEAPPPTRRGPAGGHTSWPKLMRRVPCLPADAR